MNRKKRKIIQEEQTELIVKVDKYDVCIDASMNLNLNIDRPIFTRDTDLAYQFVTTLNISGVITSSSNRNGDKLELMINGTEIHSGQFSATLSDFQFRDEHNVPQYRTYRGERYPIYKPPPGIAVLEKKRGEKAWSAWVWVSPRLVSDMLVLLTAKNELYCIIQEHKKDRKRWIQSMSLQMNAPE